MHPALSKKQSDAFIQNGYTILPNILLPSLLQKLRQLFDDKIYSTDTTDKVVNTVNGKNYVSNVEHLFKSENLACLEL